MEKLTKVQDLRESLRVECVKFFENGNNAAGTRARKILQEIKAAAQELRVAIQETKAEMAAKTASGAPAAAAIAVDGQPLEPEEE